LPMAMMLLELARRVTPLTEPRVRMYKVST
jgi:hypothetical protein